MNSEFGFGYGMGLDMHSIMFGIVFFLIVGVILFSIVRGMIQWNSNNKSPVLTVDAKVVSKRVDVWQHNHANDNLMHNSSSTSYYVTFQVESGDRMELKVNGGEYGMLVEGDTGKLTFQGTRYLSFNRDI